MVCKNCFWLGSSMLCYARLARFCIGCEIQFPQFAGLARFRIGCEIHFSSIRKACEISHKLRNSFSSALVSVLQLVLLFYFAQPCEIAGSQISSSLLIFAYLIDLSKAIKLSKAWILHVLALSSCFAMDYINFSLILGSFNDKKAIKTIKTCQKLISTLAKVLNRPIGLKGNKYYSKVFKIVYNKL